MTALLLACCSGGTSKADREAREQALKSADKVQPRIDELAASSWKMSAEEFSPVVKGTIGAVFDT
ncbi:MAG: hypothetical protein J0H73_03810 [Salana multivorans]|uniref:hypothetical protein n=1 Tax=Salana multivorans TaxID=120377 RepID=UPI00096248D8|nr:hypothetical protein [Salana multivorans]MBN8881423.1 hypothetical protein [Salana multivorans]OJX93391.1 MAG: hypothetical protein BGO96_10510 [Micrococcales bacterium 73-15]